MRTKFFKEKINLLSILLIVLILGGCGKEAPVVKQTPKVECEDLYDSTVDPEIEHSQKTKDFVPAKQKEEIDLDAESEKLYSDFIDGKVAAEFDGTADKARYLSLSNVLEDKEQYTLDDIEEKLSAGCDDEDQWIYQDNLEEGYIDLGLDGDYELKLDIGTVYSNLTLIIKNKNGELKICFVGDSWQRSVTNVWYTGEVTIFNIINPTTHSAEQGYLDENGDYYMWNKSSEEGFNVYEEGDLYYNNEFIGKNIGLYVEEISFDENSDSYYFANIVDIDNKNMEENEETKDYYEKARAALKAEGKNVITKEEADKILEKHRKEIGLSDEIYYYE